MNKNILKVLSCLFVIIFTAQLFTACSNDTKSKRKSKKNINNKESYVSFLNKKIIPDLGLYDTKNPSAGGIGLVSGLIKDLDGDGADDFVTLSYDKNKQNGVDFKVTSISTDDDDDANVTDEETIFTKDENTEEVVPSSRTQDEPENGDEEEDTAPATIEENDDDGGERHIPNRTLVYFVTHDGDEYLVTEHMEYTQSYNYFCKVFKYDDAELEEAGNIFVPGLGSDGIAEAYSTVLPKEMDIDNSDFDFNELDKAHVPYSSDDKILYFNSGNGGSYEYNTHFNSTDEAVSAFFKCFGVDKEKAVENDDDTIYELTEPDEAEMIYSYDYHTSADGEDVYNIKDYTGVIDLVEDDEQESEESEEREESKKEKQLSEAEMKDVAEENIEDIAEFDYHDYDKDGTYEAYVLSAKTGEPYSGITRVYFIDSTGKVEIVGDYEDRGFYYEDTFKYQEADDGHGFASFNFGAGGSGYATDVYSVRDAEPYKLSCDFLQGFYKDDDGDFCTTQNDFSAGYHQYPEYKLNYDSENYDFTLGEKIT